MKRAFWWKKKTKQGWYLQTRWHCVHLPVSNWTHIGKSLITMKSKIRKIFFNTFGICSWFLFFFKATEIEAFSPSLIFMGFFYFIRYHMCFLGFFLVHRLLFHFFVSSTPIWKIGKERKMKIFLHFWQERKGHDASFPYGDNTAQWKLWWLEM